MSDFIVELVTVGRLEKHPGADTLSITKVYDFPVVTRTGELKEGERAIYFPVDAVVPNHKVFQFLWTDSSGQVELAPKSRHRRIKAKKLRGVFSMGLLVPARLFEIELGPTWNDLSDGTNVADVLNVTKYEPEPEREGGGIGGRARKIPLNWWEALKERTMPKWLKSVYWRLTGHNPVRYLGLPSWFIKYTDIENIRKYGNCLEQGEYIVLTEKTHGSNGRFCYHKGHFFVGSHNCMLYPGDNDVWNEVAKKYNLARVLKRFPGLIVFGEVYGRTQRGDGYDYGLGNGVDFVVFDIFSIGQNRYFDYDDIQHWATLMGLTTVPELGRVTWNGLDSLLDFADGPSVLGRQSHVREGFVARPLRERTHPKLGRVILKLHGADYLLGKQLKKKK